MSLNISQIRWDQPVPPSRMTKFLRSLVLASAIGTGGATGASIPDDISMVTSKSMPVITDRHANLMTAKLIAGLALAASFVCWRQSITDDENQPIKRFNGVID